MASSAKQTNQKKKGSPSIAVGFAKSVGNEKTGRLSVELRPGYEGDFRVRVAGEGARLEKVIKAMIKAGYTETGELLYERSRIISIGQSGHVNKQFHTVCGAVRTALQDMAEPRPASSKKPVSRMAMKRNVRALGPKPAPRRAPTPAPTSATA